MKINSQNNISFKKLYATQKVQKTDAFQEVKGFLQENSKLIDIFINIVEEPNKENIPVEKFHIIAKKAPGSVQGTAITGHLDAGQLKKATIGAINVFAAKEVKASAEKSFSEFLRLLNMFK